MTKETGACQIQTDLEVVGDQKKFDYNELVRQVAEYCKMQDSLTSAVDEEEIKRIFEHNFYGVRFEQ